MSSRTGADDGGDSSSLRTLPTALSFNNSDAAIAFLNLLRNISQKDYQTYRRWVKQTPSADSDYCI